MKRYILLVSIALGFQLVTSQNYHPFATENTIWSVLTGGYGVGMKPCNIKTTHFTLKGEGYSPYMRVYTSTDSLMQNWLPTNWCIKEDLETKQIFKKEDDQNEELLYDFNLSNIGDSIKLWNSSFHDSLVYKLTAIDLLRFGDNTRKVFHLNCNGHKINWIEGIGSEFGFLYNDIYGLTGGFFELLCYESADFMYSNQQLNTCHITSLPPFLITQRLDSAILNQEYHFQIQLTPSTDDISFMLYSSELPDGITFDTKRGIFSGTPTETGTFGIFLSVVNNSSGFWTDLLTTNLVVKANSQLAPVSKTDNFKIWTEKESIFVSSDTESNKLTMSLINASGKLCKKLLLQAGTNCITEVKEGIYLINITDQNGYRHLSKKIIISH